jgi:hypothetical protein
MRWWWAKTTNLAIKRSFTLKCKKFDRQQGKNRETAMCGVEMTDQQKLLLKISGTSWWNF